MSRKSRRNPSGKTLLIIGGAAAAGLGLYLVTRSSEAAPLGEPIVTPAVPTPTTLPGLLRANKTARQIFNVQALAWEMGLSTDVPDARFGPRTQAVVNAAEDALSEERTIGFNPYTLFAIRHAGERGTTSLRLRLLPMYLPTDVVRLLNQEALAIDPSAILIQARPMNSSSVPSSTPVAPPPSSAPAADTTNRYYDVTISVTGTGTGVTEALARTAMSRVSTVIDGRTVVQWEYTPTVTQALGAVIVAVSGRLYASEATKGSVAATIGTRIRGKISEQFPRVTWAATPHVVWT